MFNKEKLYIFLDFDGVLNNAETDFGRTYLKANSEVGWDNYNTLATYKLINKLEEMYDVKVIISSSWKLNKTFDEFIKKLKQKKDLIDRTNIRVLTEKLIDKFADKTPDWLHDEENGYSSREIEIFSYLEQNNIVNDKILILDDEWVNIDYDDQLYWRLDENFGMTEFDCEIILVELDIKFNKKEK